MNTVRVALFDSLLVLHKQIIDAVGVADSQQDGDSFAAAHDVYEALEKKFAEAIETAKTPTREEVGQIDIGKYLAETAPVEPLKVQPSEYEVRRLDPEYELAFRENEKPLLITDDLCEAINFASERFALNREEICVWQPRTAGFRDYHKTLDDY